MVSVDIFNIKGQLVRSLLSEMQQRGSHSVIWNGRDSQDRACASGFYFYRVQQATAASPADSHDEVN
jgi:flagellar hook assembly protein FlgD